MKKTLLFAGFQLLFNLNFMLAADHGGSIRGLVAEAETNLELPGASVFLIEKNEKTASNELGTFAFFDLEEGDYTVIVSYLGFKTDTLRVHVFDHETSTVKILLKTTDIRLADVSVDELRENPLQTLGQLDLKMRPIQNAQDMLRFVPGLVIAQHAGGGKAEQIFLRGFDIDHGTDIALFADGMPVNMVSHAHGQGYADLHFVIPELIQKVDFQKGTYDASVGNFATAGAVRFETPAVLTENLLKIEGGQFDFLRSVAALDLLGKKAASRGTSAWIGAETFFNNGFFDAPQNFKRLNLMANFRQTLDDRQTLAVSVSRFRSSWLASGQIPERAVASGQIGRFGAIDPTEGGATGRQNLNIRHWLTLNDKSLIKNQFYLSNYDFELFSNFTFFLNDPANGDQIKQKESRLISGYNGSILHETLLGGKKLNTETGVQIRYDEVDDNELSRTKNRSETRSRLALGDVQELNFAPFASAKLALSKRLTVDAGLRFDVFHFSYSDALDSVFSNKTAVKKRLSPKLNLRYQLTPKVQIFALSGAGFHSNDTRVVVARTVENTLPGAFGAEVGANFKPFPALLISFSAWQLALAQEFVYVGDEAVVEPSGRTLRRGFDFSARWQVARPLFLDFDYNWTQPRSRDAAEGENFIPLAPVQTSIGGLTFEKNGFSASLRYRFVGDRAANEDFSLTAEGFFLLDALASFSPKMKNGKRPLEFSVQLLNLTNAAWKEAQFETESRLRHETDAVSEIHFTPGTPFFVKGGMVWRF